MLYTPESIPPAIAMGLDVIWTNVMTRYTSQTNHSLAFFYTRLTKEVPCSNFSQGSQSLLERPI